MRPLFQNIADKLNLTLIYANPHLANVKLDNLERSQFNYDGLAMVVSPIYTTGLALQETGFIKRLFEIAVISLMDFDCEDEDVDVKIDKCENYILQIVRELNLDVSNANQFVSKFDVNVCGVFVNAFLTNKGTLCKEFKEVKMFQLFDFDYNKPSGYGLTKISEGAFSVRSTYFNGHLAGWLSDLNIAGRYQMKLKVKLTDEQWINGRLRFVIYQNETDYNTGTGTGTGTGTWAVRRDFTFLNTNETEIVLNFSLTNEKEIKPIFRIQYLDGSTTPLRHEIREMEIFRFND